MGQPKIGGKRDFGETAHNGPHAEVVLEITII